MAKPIKTTDALDLLHQGQRVEDVVLLDLETQKLGFRDALLLTENGFVVPAGNIVYQDSDVQYDPDFDDTTWKGEYGKLSDFLAVEHTGIEFFSVTTEKNETQSRIIKNIY